MSGMGHTVEGLASVSSRCLGPHIVGDKLCDAWLQNIIDILSQVVVKFRM